MERLAGPFHHHRTNLIEMTAATRGLALPRGEEGSWWLPLLTDSQNLGERGITFVVGGRLEVRGLGGG